MTARIAVLGAGGFIGSHLAPALAERFGCEVDAVDVTFEKLVSKDPRIHRRCARVEDAGVVEEVTRRASLVISLTALCNPSLYSTFPLEVIDASFTHLLPLVKLCTERRVRLIHFSTAEVYGRRAMNAAGEPAAEMTEDDSCSLFGPVHRERWTYACAKQLMERVIWAQGKHHGLEFSIVRPFNTIGPRMDYLPGVDGDGIPRVLACFIDQLLRGEPLSLVGGGRQRRAFMDVADMVEAVCRMVERRGPCRGQIVNLGNPANEVSIADLARLLAREFSALAPLARAARFEHVTADEFYGEGYDDTEQRVPDIGKARSLLGWEPRVSLSEMLPAILGDYLERYAGRVASRTSRFEREPERVA
ncbi:MAG: NAD-dependent epimerase/dehydratase family protein [Myxococcales bacterium]|nr:MAG: NAD-dependent epimerase/dehydratase family protein [Myxococcales bacterium]